jgi:hypothetical protein
MPFGTAMKLYVFQKKWTLSLLFEVQEVLCPIYSFIVITAAESITLLTLLKLTNNYSHENLEMNESKITWNVSLIILEMQSVIQRNKRRRWRGQFSIQEWRV